MNFNFHDCHLAAVQAVPSEAGFAWAALVQTSDGHRVATGILPGATEDVAVYTGRIAGTRLLPPEGAAIMIAPSMSSPPFALSVEAHEAVASRLGKFELYTPTDTVGRRLAPLVSAARALAELAARSEEPSWVRDRQYAEG